MRVRSVVVSTLALGAATLLCPALQAAPVESSKVPSECGPLPEYQAPQDPGQLFYMQLTGYPDTIVYAVRKNGNKNGDENSGERIDPDDPVQVYWRKYSEQGQRKELTTLQRSLAFGVQYSDFDSQTHPRLVNLIAYPSRKARIESDAGGNHHVVMDISDETARLVCIFVEWRPWVGIIPHVLHVDLVGRSLDGKRTIRERIEP